MTTLLHSKTTSNTKKTMHQNNSSHLRSTAGRLSKPCSRQTVQISAEFFVCAVQTGAQREPDTSIPSSAETLHAIPATQNQAVFV